MMAALWRWLCRHNIHPWRRGGRDVTDRNFYICRVCSVVGRLP